MGENFVPIQMRTLQDGLPFSFNLYVKVNQKYLLYLRHGDSLESERLQKLREYKGERFFINKSDLPAFKNFIGELLDETLETDSLSDDAEKKEEEDTAYFDFKDIDQAPPKKEASTSKSKSKVKLSAQIKSMMAHQNRQQEGAEQKLQRQAEVVNSVAKTAIDVINRILKDPDSFVAYQVLQKSAKGLKAALGKGPRFFYKLYHMEASEETPLLNHTKNVAVLAVRLGMLHKLPDDQLEDLAIAAMIHDIGLIQIADEHNPIQLFLTPKNELAPEQKKIYDSHIKKSIQVIEEKEFIPKSILTLVENHEENLSGFGPLGKTKLPLEQQILCLTNRYEEFMREQKLGPKKAIQELAINEVGNYDLKLIESLKKMAATLTQR